MQNNKNRAFLVGNHLKSVFGSTQQKTALINGRKWTWLEAGDPAATETVVLLHGLAMSRNHWRTVIAPLQGRYRVIVPDIPGLNLKYPALNPEQGFSGIGAEVQSFLNVIVDKPVHLVGHSMGATLCLSLAVRMTVPVLSLSLVSLADVNFSKSLTIKSQIQQFSDYFAELDFAGHCHYLRSMFYKPPFMLEAMARLSWKEIQPKQQYIVALLTAMEAELTHLDSFLADLNLPVLSVTGQQDPWNDLTRKGKFEQIFNLQHIEIARCRHLPFIETPIEFCRLLTEFLSSQPNRYLPKASVLSAIEREKRYVSSSKIKF